MKLKVSEEEHKLHIRMNQIQNTQRDLLEKIELLKQLKQAPIKDRKKIHLVSQLIIGQKKTYSKMTLIKEPKIRRFV